MQHESSIRHGTSDWGYFLLPLPNHPHSSDSIALHHVYVHEDGFEIPRGMSLYCIHCLKPIVSHITSTIAQLLEDRSHHLHREAAWLTKGA